MKKTFITFFSCIMAIFTITFAACSIGNANTNDEEEINQAVDAALDFLYATIDSGSYSSISEYSDGRVYKYYTEDDKIKVEYNEVFYGVKIENCLYKISQADDMSWHMHTDITDLRDPVDRTYTLINGIKNVSRASLWTNYNRRTKTLTATYSDAKGIFKLKGKVFTVTYYMDSGTTTRHTIKDVGNTTVTLPENIINDTQK